MREPRICISSEDISHLFMKSEKLAITETGFLIHLQTTDHTETVVNVAEQPISPKCLLAKAKIASEMPVPHSLGK